MTEKRAAAGLLLFLVVFMLYQVTYSSVPTSDGYTWIAHIDSGDPEQVLPAYHALPMYLLFRLKQLVARCGIAVPTLVLIQTVNAVLAGIGAVLLYSVITILEGGILLGWLGGALLAVSFGYWYFANGELHHFSLVLLQLIFLLLVRARVRGRRYGYGGLVGLGLLNALAVLFHQENFLFGITAVALLLVGRPWRRGLIDAGVYAIAGSLWMAMLATLAGLYLRGAGSVDDLRHWFFWLFYTFGEPQPYTLGTPWVAILRMVKGQATAFIFGTQVVSDVAQAPMRPGSPVIALVLGLTLVAYGIVAVLLVTLWSQRRSMRTHWLVSAVGCATWILSYKVLLHTWFWPTAPEYHVVTLPPLILLVLLGPMIRRAQRSGPPRVPRWPVAAVTALLVLVAAVNFHAAMRPWYRYGQMKEVLAARFRATSRPGDFFISSESGIDSVFQRPGNHLAVKAVFTHASKDEGFVTIRTAISERLARGQRVFVYNLVPTPFTLLRMNHAAGARGSASLRAQDFEDLMVDLKRRYVTIPALTYWEESRTPLYLFGEQSDVMWELKAPANAAG